MNPKKFIPIAIIGVALATSLIGTQRYEHIDGSFWKIWLVTVYPIMAAYFVTWHLTINGHKRKRNESYSMLPGTIFVMALAFFVAILFSGNLLIINSFGNIKEKKEAVILKEIYSSMRYNRLTSVAVHRELDQGDFKFYPPETRSNLRLGSRYILEYKIGLLGIGYLDSKSKLEEINNQNLEK